MSKAAPDQSPPSHSSIDTLHLASRALAHAGALFHVLHVALNSEEHDGFDLAALAEIGLELTGRYQEQTDEVLARFAKG